MEIQTEDKELWQFIANYVDYEPFQNEFSGHLLSILGHTSNANPELWTQTNFGFVVENPIPVNGQLGELAYLSKLRRPDGQGFLFHRLGSIGLIDKYELLSFDGRTSLELFLDLYNLERSQLPPKGLGLEKSPCVFTGTPMRLDNFPFGLLDEVSENEFPTSVAYISVDRLKPILENLNKSGYQVSDAVERFDNEVDFDDGQGEYGNYEGLDSEEAPSSWRDLVSETQIAEAREPRGCIAPTDTDAEALAPGLYYGWRPSKALAKRKGLDPDELYDPVAEVVQDALSAYLDLLPEFAGSFQATPKFIRLDRNGFLTEYRVSGSMEQAKDFLDFVASYWAPSKTYFLDSTWFEVPGRYSDSGRSEVYLHFRWLDRMDPKVWAIKEEEAKSIFESHLPYSFTKSRNLVLNKRRGSEICIVCGEPGLIWCTPELAQQISDWQFEKISHLPASLTPSERETLMSGIHEWCYPKLNPDDN